MSTFTALVLTAPPPGHTGESSGAMAKVDGRESVLRCVELFLNRDNIKQILLAISPESEEEIKRKFGGALGFMGIKLVIGGKKWGEQIAAAVPKIAAESSHILVHDASRPVVPYADIDALLESAERHAAVALVAPLRGALVELDEGGGAMALHQPTAFVQLLTPQAVSRARLVEWGGGRDIHPTEWTLLKGSALNIRLNGAGDAALAKAMLGLLPKPKSKAPSNPFEEAQW